MFDTLSIFLAKLIGFAFLIVGFALIIKTKNFQKTFKEISKSDAFMTLIAILPLVAGLGVVLSHNIWINNWTVMITIIGWVMLIIGLVRLFFHKFIMEKIAMISKNKITIKTIGLVLIVIGAVLLFFSL